MAAPTLDPALLDAAVELLGESGRGGTVFVQGTSMLPTLHEGQRLYATFRVDRPRRGDLLLFRQVDYLVVHRLVGRTRTPEGGRAWRTRGDAKIILDPPVRPQKVVGRVLAAETAEGWIGFEGRRSRIYAVLLAWHGLAWWSAGAVGHFIDRGLRKTLKWTPGVRAGVGRVDRALMRLAHALLFDWAHPQVGPPVSPATDEASPSENGASSR